MWSGSGDGAVEQVAVLGDRSRQHREVDLAVLVDSDDADHCLGGLVSGEHDGAGADALWRSCVGEGGPAEAVVVFGVEVGDEVDVDHGWSSILTAHGTGPGW